MKPTLTSGDCVLVNSQNFDSSSIQYSDLVAIQFSQRDYPMVKRVVAIPQDRVWLNNQGLWVNDTLIRATPKHQKKSYGLALHNQLKRYENVVPAMNLIVLGDNPENSRDSMRYGLVSFSQIVGKIVHTDSGCRNNTQH